MKAFSIAMTAVCLAALAAAAQDVDPQCGNMHDKVACTCALQNGGRIARTPALKKKSWLLRQRDARQPADIPDNERIVFPAKFKLKGWRLRPSPQVEGYLNCMHRHGRK